jgi:hypothetical protein
MHCARGDEYHPIELALKASHNTLPNFRQPLLRIDPLAHLLSLLSRWMRRQTLAT